MYLTWLDSNSWLIEINHQRILLDPWLIGPLVFGNLPWLFKGSRLSDRAIPDQIDLILLSQGLEDHTHPPTLKQINRSTRVVASVNAAKIVRELGFTQVSALAHGESFTLNQSVEIKALPGSTVGVNLVENGYLLKDQSSGKSLYYEPHGFHDPILKEFAPIDLVITPIIDLVLPLIGPVIKGSQSAVDLAKLVKPQVILPTAAGGDILFEGLLLSLLKAVGNIEELRSQLAKNQLSTQVIEAVPGERMEIKLS